MHSGRLFVFVLLGAALVTHARAEDELLDDAPPVPPATAAAMGEAAKPAASAHTSTPAFKPAPPPSAPNALPQAPGYAPPAEPTADFAPAPEPPPAPQAVPAASAAPALQSAGTSHAPIANTVVATSSTAATGATAEADRRPLQVAALVGIGTTFDHTPGGVNPLGFGFGLRGDFRLLDELALGARVLYFVGGSSELPTGKIDMTSWLISTEASYVLDLDPVLVEPGVLVGVSSRNLAGRPAFTSATTPGFVPGSQNQALVGLYIAPGVNVVVPLSIIGREFAPFFLGGDARLDLVFVRGVSSNIQLLVQGGLRL